MRIRIFLRMLEVQKECADFETGMFVALVDKVVIQQDGHMEFCFRNGMLGIRNMREQCFLTAAIQNIKRMVSSFFLALFCLSLQQNPAFADWRGLSMV